MRSAPDAAQASSWARTASSTEDDAVSACVAIVAGMAWAASTICRQSAS